MKCFKNINLAVLGLGFCFTASSAFSEGWEENFSHHLKFESVTRVDGLTENDIILPTGKIEFNYTNDEFEALYRGLNKIEVEIKVNPTSVYGNEIKIKLSAESGSEARNAFQAQMPAIQDSIKESKITFTPRYTYAGLHIPFEVERIKGSKAAIFKSLDDTGSSLFKFLIVLADQFKVPSFVIKSIHSSLNLDQFFKNKPTFEMYNRFLDRRYVSLDKAHGESSNDAGMSASFSTLRLGTSSNSSSSSSTSTHTSSGQFSLISYNHPVLGPNAFTDPQGMKWSQRMTDASGHLLLLTQDDAYDRCQALGAQLPSKNEWQRFFGDINSGSSVFDTFQVPSFVQHGYASSMCSEEWTNDSGVTAKVYNGTFSYKGAREKAHFRCVYLSSEFRKVKPAPAAERGFLYEFHVGYPGSNT